MKSKYVYLFIGLTAVLLRLFLNYQSEIIPGVTGGYYALQVKSILEHGTMAFKDMPLVFYFEALIVKVISFISAGTDLHSLILNVLKITDSLIMPLMLIPFYMICRRFNRSDNMRFEFLLAAFLVLTYGPLFLTVEAEKNAFGLVFFLFFSYYLLSWLSAPERKYLLLALLILILIAVTHFGVFTISLALLFISLIIFYRRKAWLPILLVTVSGMALVAVFDTDRAMRLFNSWNKIIGNPLWRLVYYPQGIISLIFCIYLVVVLLRTIKAQRLLTDVKERKIIQSLTVFIIVLSIPVYSFPLWHRFHLMVNIPIVLALLFAWSSIRKNAKNVLISSLLIILFASVAIHLLHPKQNFISKEAYKEFKELKQLMPDPDQTIVIAAHGLNFWASWELDTKMADSHVIINDEMQEKYDTIFMVKIKKGKNKMYPGRNSPFPDPDIPAGSELFYSGEYIDLYRFIK